MLFTSLQYALSYSTVSSVSTNSAPSFSVGNWWTETGQYHYTANGTASYYGTWSEDAHYTVQYTVLKQEGGLLDISRFVKGSWTSKATGTWVSPSGGATNQGDYSLTNEYTVMMSTMKVVNVSTTWKDWVGHPFLFMVNPAALSEGGASINGWWVPSGDAKSQNWTEVPWKVGRQTIAFKGMTLNVWSLTYTGNTFGWWRNGQDVHSVGPTTNTYLYDPLYGIDVGYSGSGTSAIHESGGSGWTETYSESYQLSDTNLQFQVQYTLTEEPANAFVTVDGVVYAGSQLPKIFTWDIGSTHNLQVNATIQGPTGTRYVFIQWSDGVKDLSRTLTASQTTELKAMFKTQYQLSVVSEIGDPKGSGWYDTGTTATFSVTSPQPEAGFFGSLGGKSVFQTWSGDSTASSTAASITIDGPKTVRAQWTVDNTQPLMILGGITVVIVIIAGIVAFTMMKRRKSA